MREIGDIVRQFERRQRAAVAGLIERRYSEPYALATLVRARGSSYRRPGARMMVAADGSAVGSLSGGCLEEEVIARAQQVLQTGTPAWMEFDTRRRFGCHGALEIFIERAASGFFAELAECYHARRSAMLATCFGRDGVEVGTRFVDGEECEAPETFVQRIAPPVPIVTAGQRASE